MTLNLALVVLLAIAVVIVMSAIQLIPQACAGIIE